MINLNFRDNLNNLKQNIQSKNIKMRVLRAFLSFSQHQTRGAVALKGFGDEVKIYYSVLFKLSMIFIKLNTYPYFLIFVDYS
jgi:hypothetical protein